MSSSNIPAGDVHERVMALQNSRTNEEWQALIDRAVERLQLDDATELSDHRKLRLASVKEAAERTTTSPALLKRAKLSKASVQSAG